MNYPAAPENSAFRAFFESLEALDIGYAGATGKGGQFHCPNPDHDDENASFDVIVGRNGKPIFACAPCDLSLGREEFVKVLREAGVRWSGDPVRPEEVDWTEQAAPSYSKGSNGSFVQGQPSAVYTYKHADGKPNFKVYRFDFTRENGKPGKSFQPRRFEDGRYVVGLDGVQRTPYKLERFADWHEAGQRILYLVEGEKATEALLKVRRPATTFHGGTNAAPHPNWVSRYGFKEWDEVRVWPDADEAGVLWARERLAELEAAGVSASIWGPRVGSETVEPKDDAYDVLGRGERPHRLLPDDLEALAALNPLPVRSAARETAPPILVGGKPLVSVSAGGGTGSGNEGVSDVVEEPYPVSIATEPYVFAEEMVQRHFTAEGSGVLTLRCGLDGAFWRWDERVNRYRLRKDKELKALISLLLKGAEETVWVKESGREPNKTPGYFTTRPVAVDSRKVKELCNHLESLTLVSDERGAGGDLLPAEGGVPFRNGWLDIESGLLLPIGPERDVRWNVPMDYSPDAGEPVAWFAFLDSIGFTEGTDERRLLQQWFGYLLSGSKAQQKALLLLGPRRAGKGTIIDVAHAMLGDGAAGTTLDSLVRNFGLQGLIGKGLATIGDARFGFNSPPALEERLLSLTGEDPMPVDIKNKEPVTMRLGVRLMIGTNELPKFIAASNAVGGRFVILKFTRSFYGREDLRLRSRVLSELPAIVKWALEGYHDLCGLGAFVETEAGAELQTQMILDAAPVRRFVEEECELDPSFWIPNDDLYREYELWCGKNGIKYVLDKPRFGRDINTAFDGVVFERQRRIGSKPVRGRSGLRMTK